VQASARLSVQHRQRIIAHAALSTVIFRTLECACVRAWYWTVRGLCCTYIPRCMYTPRYCTGTMPTAQYLHRTWPTMRRVQGTGLAGFRPKLKYYLRSTPVYEEQPGPKSELPMSMAGLVLRRSRQLGFGPRAVESRAPCCRRPRVGRQHDTSPLVRPAIVHRPRTGRVS
jgi:hypothetical protein